MMFFVERVGILKNIDIKKENEMAKIYKKIGKNQLIIPPNFDWPREPFVFLDLCDRFCDIVHQLPATQKRVLREPHALGG